ncbi:MAG: heme exporter protein CcmD [Candidatus Berkiella sp.]
MGGYGIYIWPSYGLVLGGMLILLLRAKREAKRVERKLMNANKRSS